MKVSLNWVRQYVDIDIDAAELIEKIGTQLGGVDEVLDLGSRYTGALIAKVITVEDHPDADRLHVCKIDDGGKAADVERDDEGYVQVVCGAPNVRAGMLVVWLPPGSTVPESYGKDPFVLEARKLRGVVSNGMLASSRELALTDEHDGILEVDIPVEPGVSFAETYDLNDTIIDIENKMFTHRPDCFGQLGVAREIAGILGKRFVSPDWYSKTVEMATTGSLLPLKIVNEVPELVPHLVVAALADVTVKPSPIRMQTFLTRVGVRPINNIVDITNYIMLLTGQPTHAYDYDKVKALGGGEAAIIARLPRKNETLTLLNGKTITPREEAVVIASNSGAIGLAGVMGGSETEVDDGTKNIILEVATFDMYSIRRTSMAHGLFTDAVTRFNKGQSPAQNDVIAYYAMSKLAEASGAQLASEVFDSAYDKNIDYWAPISITPQFIEVRLGVALSAEEIQTILDNVEFAVEIKKDGELEVRAPFWRTDISIAEDIVEEVGRLYGFDKLPQELPTRSITPAAKDPLLELKTKVRHSLRIAGANEVLTYSFVHGKLLENVGQDPNQAFMLGNALSPDLQYYRLNVLPSLLDKVHLNSKAGYGKFALFEIGKNHILNHFDDDADGLPTEFDVLAFVYAADKKQQPVGSAFYEARKFLSNLGADFGLKLRFTPAVELPDLPIAKPYDAARSAYVTVDGTEQFLGIIGEFKPEVRKRLKLPVATSGFEISLKELLNAKPNISGYAPLPRFPKVEQDISFKLAADVQYGDLFDCAWKAVEGSRPDHTHAQLGPIDIYQKSGETAYKHITLRLSLASYERTLIERDASKVLTAVSKAAREQFAAERI